jgi:hypothetical protein
MISIFCVQGSKILGQMDFCERITSCRYIHKNACKRSILAQFHGTIAIGTDQGKIFLIDIMLPSNAHGKRKKKKLTNSKSESYVVIAVVFRNCLITEL